MEDRQLYQTFSEFSALMLMNRQIQNDKHPRSLKRQMDKIERQTDQKRDFLDSLFPINEKMSSLQYNRLQAEFQYKEFKLKDKDLADFRVPATIIMDSSEVLRPCRKELRPLILAATGIPTGDKGAKVSYEQFLNLVSFITHNKGTKEEYIMFFTRVFDPTMGGFTTNQEFEQIIDMMFDNEGNDDEEGGADIDNETVQNNSQENQKKEEGEKADDEQEQ